jgi:hypothetical protein
MARSRGLGDVYKRQPLFKQMYQDLADARAFFAKIKE